jgi:hypothetical protein
VRAPGQGDRQKSTLMESVQSSLADRFVQLLSVVGFAPVNGAALPFVFKTGWLLTMTGFNPIQIVGLAIYIFSAPVWAFFPIFLSRCSSTNSADTPWTSRGAFQLECPSLVHGCRGCMVRPLRRCECGGRGPQEVAGIVPPRRTIAIGTSSYNHRLPSVSGQPTYQ